MRMMISMGLSSRQQHPPMKEEMPPDKNDNGCGICAFFKNPYDYSIC